MQWARRKKKATKRTSGADLLGSNESAFYRRRKRLGDFLYRLRREMPAMSARGSKALYMYLVKLRREMPQTPQQGSSALFRRRKLLGEYLVKLRREMPAMSAKGTSAFVRKIPGKGIKALGAIKATASDLIRKRVFRQLLDMALAFKKVRLRQIPALGFKFAGQSVAYASFFGRRLREGNLTLPNLWKGLSNMPVRGVSTSLPSHTLLKGPGLGVLKNAWSRNSSRKMFSLGFFSGVVLAVMGGITYVRYNIPILQNAIANFSMKSFTMAKSYQKRKWIYLTFPEYNLRFLKGVEAKIILELSKLWRRGDSGDNLAMELFLKTEEDFSNEHSLATPMSMKGAWSEMVLKAANAAQSSQLLRFHTAMKDVLVEEVVGNEDMTLQEKVLEIRELLPASVERDHLVNEMLQGHMVSHKWLPSHVLEANPPHDPPQICDPWNAIIRLAVLFYPGALNHLILYLDGQMTVDEVVEAAEGKAGWKGDRSDGELASTTPTADPTVDPTAEHLLSNKNAMALKVLKDQYDRLPPRLQDHVLQSAVTAKIELLPTISGHGMSSKSAALSRAVSRSRAGDKESLSPHQLYVKSIDNDLLGPLRRDAKIPQHALNQVKTVFLGLPSELQARILLTAIRHPSARGAVSPTMQATVVRDIFSAGGVVAVKLAQMLSEDSRVPRHYKELLGSLRDDNTALELCEFWHSIPTTMKSLVSHIGPALGTGSVKDVRSVRLWPNEECALAVLRKRVEDEALASLTALQASPELEPIAARLGRLVYREFNLYEEGEALEEFAQTSIGMHPKFKIVKVKHHNPKCLVEEIAEGPTVAKYLNGEWQESARKGHLKETFSTLVEFHRAVLGAFAQGGLIHSDIHLGNMIHQVQEDDTVNFVLFDIGQFERIGKSDTIALLWAMCWISKPERHNLLRKVAVDHLVKTCSLRDEDKFPFGADFELEKRINDAFNKAVQPNADGTLPDTRTAWIFFLKNSEASGVSMPKGAFALAKMMDGIVSQQRSYSLENVLDKTIENFLLHDMTWKEWSNLVVGKISRFPAVR
jgi:hypothetical protein